MSDFGTRSMKKCLGEQLNPIDNRMGGYQIGFCDKKRQMIKRDNNRMGSYQIDFYGSVTKASNYKA